jgi:ubiquinone/menaquinone biosynthesis C-methylase UbiE
MSYVFMKALESAPSRYDRGIGIITFGEVNSVYNRVASRIEKGWTVLDVGCGTGALSLRAGERGAQVIGIDVNSQMLEIAEKRRQEMRISGSVEFREQGIAELSDEPAASYDAVSCGLVLSELSRDERAYSLKQFRRLLKPDGLLLIVDETVPSNFIKAVLFWLMRIPLVVITYILTQTTTTAIGNLQDLVTGAGFTIEESRNNWLGSLTELVCRNPSASRGVR